MHCYMSDSELIATVLLIGWKNTHERIFIAPKQYSTGLSFLKMNNGAFMLNNQRTYTSAQQTFDIIMKEIKLANDK